MSLSDMLLNAFTGKVFEPVKRNKDGLRWIRHRFPIKGGISLREIMVREATKTNALIKFIRGEHSDDSS